MHRLFIFILVGIVSVMAQDDLQVRVLTAKNKVFPALVHIEPVKEIFSSGTRVKVKVTGSGVIFSPNGLVLTNNHVAEKAHQVRCTLANRLEVPAEVIGLDALTDLAVLKLDLSGTEYDSLPYVKLGDSDQLEVGDFVIALGSPLGLSRSLSMGVVSSIDRYFEDSGEMVSPFNLWIQTDAAINPGNSGGPLVNLQGEVIGINARAIFFGENLGFAIPVNTAKVVIEQILAHGEVDRSWIGIEWQEIKEYRYYINNLKLEGVLIAYIETGAPAERAGLQAGDLVYRINDQPVTAIYREELPRIRKLISEIPVNSRVQIGYIRSGKQMETVVHSESRGKFEGTEFECAGWGLSVKELTPRIIQNLKLKEKEGVLVSGVRLGGLAHEAEVFRGSVITSIDRQKIKNLEQFKQLYPNLEKLPEKGRMLQLTFRNATMFALLKEK